MTGKIFLIHWTDPAVGNQWRDISEVAKEAPHPAWSCGEIVEKNQTYLVVAPHRSGSQVNGEATIPISLIHSMVELVAKPEPFVTAEAPVETKEDVENG
jgi:hypothetical protein